MKMGKLQGEDSRVRRVLIALHGSDGSQKDLRIVTKEGQTHLCHAALLASTSAFFRLILKDYAKDENGQGLLLLKFFTAGS